LRKYTSKQLIYRLAYSIVYYFIVRCCRRAGKGVNRWMMRFDVDVEVIAGARDAVAAGLGTTAGVAGVVYGVAAAAVDSSHVSRSRFSQAH
jgi:hypothetical protein